MREFANASFIWRLERLRSEMALAVGAGLILAMLGPFQTVEIAFFSKIGFWIALSALWFALMTLVEPWLGNLPPVRCLAPGYRLALTVCLAAMPMLMVVVPASDMLGTERIELMCLPQLYPKVLLIGSGLSLLSFALFAEETGPFRAGFRARLSGVSGSDGDESHPSLGKPLLPVAPCPLRSELPGGPSGVIQCLEMEDHYVRVHDEHTSALVLMRLTDAIEALGEDSGLRVHRSWWVARNAVTGLERQGRNFRIRLANGLAVPVSQSYRQAVITAFGHRV
jgi:hypothetical protein